MMRPSLPASRPSVISFSLLISYSLLLALVAPFSVRRAEAAFASSTVKVTSSSVSGKPLAQKSGGKRQDELLIRFREGVSEQEKNVLVGAKGLRRKNKLRGKSRIEKLELSNGQEPEAVAESLRYLPAIEFAEPNYLISHSDVLPDDPSFAGQWALRNTGQSGGQIGSDIKAAAAWEATTGATSTVIAIIDSGIDFTHPDLVNNQWTNTNETDNHRDDDNDGLTDDLHGWDWTTGTNVIRDEQGHGTAIAGIIAAEGNNGAGISGVMWRASLMSLRVLDNTGTGDVANAIEAIDYATAHGAQIINCSWGTDQFSAALRDAIDRAGRADVAVVCSAGNAGSDLEVTPYYPASFGLPNLIAVAATNNFDQLASWSNYGASHVAIAAPGTDILTTQMGGGYRLVSGTSASTPFVTGVAGLVKTMRGWLSAPDTIAAIKGGARATSGLSGRVSTGSVLDAAGALAAMPTTAAVPPPSGGNYNAPPPPVTQGTPDSNLPNLDTVRDTPPTDPVPINRIRANVPCSDCNAGDGGGGGGGYLPPGDPRYSTARTRPENETGQPGVDLGSRNLNWALPILYLPGRSGLDLSLTLTYNSLVWTKQGDGIKYNADRGFPGPGFRLGFPTLQPRYLNSDTSVYSYMMVLPSGARVEMRQVGTSYTYESSDSTYTQMNYYPWGAGLAIVRTTDGTQLQFEPSVDGEMRCTQIKDRNGNFIVLSYDGYGHIYRAYDTLGHTIYFNYDADHNLDTITQLWGGTWHRWAKFYYGSVMLQPSFGSLSVNMPASGSQSVLTSVVFEDESRSDFSYTNWGQVWKIARFAPDGSQLAYTSYNLPGSPLLASTGQTDCPRFSEQRVWARDWNNGAEALTTFNVNRDAQTGVVISNEMTLPDRTTKVKEYFSTAANWEKGLTTATEIYSGTRKVKWTTTAWTQDDINIGYQKNPRPREINIYDEAGNRRRTEIIYHPVFGLPNIIKEYAADGTTLLRQTVTDYNLAQVYLDRRVIGLPSKVQVTDENNQYVSKMTYDYDQGGEYLAPMPQAATQHDAANYGTSFVAGRGNLTTVSRWDVTDIDNAAKAVQQRSGYNTTGSVIFTRDALNHQSSISYTDSFFDGNTSRNTFAYPTQATDADSHQSTAQYDYNFGAVTKIQGPPPAGNTQGLVQKLTYDKMLRVTRVSTEFNGAEYYYQRWVYYNDGVTEVAYSSVNNLVDDTYNYTARDGAGNVRATAQYHPGSVGGYSAQITYRDVMNRVVKQSNPTEINASFQNVGDDASGWQWTLQAYDWKGRPTLTTLPGGATVENTYGGCGCAGGEQVTTRDERGRQRKLYKDVLGRLKKVEELNWNGTVYSTTIYDYNARDQMKSITQGNRIRSFDYDGHGRLWKRTTPEQGQLEYKYKTDDTLDWVKDARGVKTIFGYNNRHLVESIAYDLSGVLAGQNVAATPGVSYTYDAAGNRTQMVTAGVSTVNYYYDQLSRMTSETIQFNGFPLPPLHTLAYGYNRAGELTSLTNPFNSTVSYTYDRMGRPTNVNGTGDVSAPAYVSNVSYRAWGAAKQVNYGNTRTLTANYDNRLRMTQWNIAGVLGYDYSYNHNYENSGRVTFARNLTTTQPNSQAAARDATLDRSYDYDHVGRLTSTHTGSEARAAIGEPWSGLYDGPYSQGYVYDQWGNMTERGGWGGENASYAAITFPASNRLPHNPVTGAPVAYDAAGNVTSDGSQTFTYDATGQQTSASGASTQMQYDGDRLRVRKTENAGTVYYIRSSVLGGQVVADATGTGTWVRGYIYVGGQLLAYQENGRVLWVHEEPVTKAKRTTDTQGAVHSITELDPWGGETNRSSGSWLLPHKYTSYERDANGSDEAMHRRYNRLSRFDQPDPYDGSYNLTDPQSFNRYSYVQNDPVNFVDPTGLMCYNVIRTDYYSDTGQVIGSFVVDTFCDTWGGINIGNFDVTVHAGTEPMLNHAPPSQDTNIHGCLTISKILNNPLFAEALAGNWRQTEKSKEENGGWWFYDAAANTLHMNGATEGRHVDLGPPYGVRPSMPKEQDEFMDQFRQFRENGRSVVFIGMFHTHPGGYAHPDQPDYWNLINNPGKSAFPNAFGVIITGVGKYTVYNSRGELSAGDPRRDECLN